MVIHAEPGCETVAPVSVSIVSFSVAGIMTHLSFSPPLRTMSISSPALSSSVSPLAGLHLNRLR